MKVLDKCLLVKEFVSENRGRCIGFVPTMGALHSGHISLVERAKSVCDVVIVSIFVNPTQFNDPKDLKCYPRMPEQDILMLKECGVDVIFMPTAQEIYPEPDTRVFEFGMVDKVMEGATRLGHFNGVAQVVSRLFDIVAPTKAFFGEKDFQQVAVIREMVAQLDSPVEIVTCPTLRGVDGLALSSRNVLLDKECREVAPHIYASLKRFANNYKEMTPEQVVIEVVGSVEANGLLKVIYFNIVDADTLEDVLSWEGHRSIQGCIAVQAGGVRLIDNINFL